MKIGPEFQADHASTVVAGDKIPAKGAVQPVNQEFAIFVHRFGSVAVFLFVREPIIRLNSHLLKHADEGSPAHEHCPAPGQPC